MPAISEQSRSEIFEHERKRICTVHLFSKSGKWDKKELEKRKKLAAVAVAEQWKTDGQDLDKNLCPIGRHSAKRPLWAYLIVFSLPA